MKTRVIDGALATIAVILLAWTMAVQTASKETPSVNELDVRQLELQPRLWDAQQALPEHVRSAIGLDGTGDTEDTPADSLGSASDVVQGVRDEVDRYFGWSFDMRALAITIAVVMGENESALRQIQSLREHSDLNLKEREIVKSLRDLAQGKPSSTYAALDARLESVGASTWLRTKLKARHLETDKDSESAKTQLAQASDENTTYVSRMTLVVLCTMAFFILGMLVLLGSPWLSRSLRRRGHLGLSVTSSPFDTRSTLRVVTAWFLFYACSHVVISFVMTLLGPFASRGPLSIATVSLLHGGASLVLIQTFGRLEGDNRSLGECLRFRSEDASGGWGAFFLWVLGGFALTVAIAVVAVFLNEALLGEDLGQQSSIQLFAENQETADLVILLTAVCIFAPVFEEILFRGFLYRNLRDRLGPWLGLTISSFIFAVAHLDMANMVPLFAIGFAFGLSYERSGSLWIPVLIHGLWNLSTVLRILSLLG